jgi:hypothetical protein
MSNIQADLERPIQRRIDTTRLIYAAIEAKKQNEPTSSNWAAGPDNGVPPVVELWQESGPPSPAPRANTSVPKPVAKPDVPSGQLVTRQHMGPAGLTPVGSQGSKFKCILGHVHTYSSPSATKCPSCYGPPYLVRLRKYLEALFEVPFLIHSDAGALYNKSLKICVGSEIPGWLNISSTIQYHVHQFLRKNRNLFTENVRAKLPPI